MADIAPGYPRLASLMGAHPEIATFRRFGALNALNLLYMQAELTDLENSLHKQAKSDAESGHPDRSIYHRDWQTLSESLTTEDGNPAQWRTMLKVKDKLSEYSKYEEIHGRIRLVANNFPPRPSSLLAAYDCGVRTIERTGFQIPPGELSGGFYI